MYGRDPWQRTGYSHGYPYAPRSPWKAIFGRVNWLIVAGFVALLGLCLYALIRMPTQYGVLASVGLVVTGWIFSLCLHEFAHAATAVLGGDTSESTASYLTFNPFRYLHPVYSIVLPVLFLLLGFIALPGGAVYLRRDLVRSRGWQSAISFAGPAMNMLFVLVVTAPFSLGYITRYPQLGPALAALAFFQCAAIILNLLPIPGLDGFGIIAPWLPRELLAVLYPLANAGMLILFIAIWQIPAIGAAYFGTVDHLLTSLHVDPFQALTGLQLLRFH